MKQSILILFTITSLSSFAQNFRTANTVHSTYYENPFIADVSKKSSFKTDNYTISGSDTLIYFLEQYIGALTFDSIGNYYCIDSSSTPWQGEKVLLSTTGDDVYYNKNNHSILIKTQADIGESWLMFEDSIKVTATITAINFESVLGIMDSVKTFT